MIKTPDQQQVRTRENVRGGEGIITFHDFLLEGESCGAGKLFSRTVLPAGSSIGEHRHEGEFEVYYVLSGAVEVLDHDAWHVMRQGDMHVCANGESHALRNNASGDAQVLMLILNDRSEAQK